MRNVAIGMGCLLPGLLLLLLLLLLLFRRGNVNLQGLQRRVQDWMERALSNPWQTFFQQGCHALGARHRRRRDGSRNPVCGGCHNDDDAASVGPKSVPQWCVVGE